MLQESSLQLFANLEVSESINIYVFFKLFFFGVENFVAENSMFSSNYSSNKGLPDSMSLDEVAEKSVNDLLSSSNLEIACMMHKFSHVPRIDHLEY